MVPLPRTPRVASRRCRAACMQRYDACAHGQHRVPVLHTEDCSRVLARNEANCIRPSDETTALAVWERTS
eukprot:6210011-Pleurochrysis_carterae.AAC.3